MKAKINYEVGKTATFTPSRQAEWIEGFNEILNATPYTRNKLTEHLISLGIEAYNQGAEVADVPENSPSLADKVILQYDDFSSEENELIQTAYFQGILKSFAKELIESMDSAKDLVASNYLEKEVSEIGSKAVEQKETEVPKEEPIPSIPEPVEKSEKIDEPIIELNEPIKEQVPPKAEPPVRKKASIGAALNFMKSTQINDS